MRARGMNRVSRMMRGAMVGVCNTGERNIGACDVSEFDLSKCDIRSIVLPRFIAGHAPGDSAGERIRYHGAFGEAALPSSRLKMPVRVESLARAQDPSFTKQPEHTHG